MRGMAGLLLVLPVVAVAAPVPTHLMAKPEIQLRFNPDKHPLGSTFEITIRNAGGADLQIWTDRPYGIAAFLDADVRNEKDERVSRLYRWNTPADRDAVSKLVETIPVGKPYATTLPVFNSVDEANLRVGKYKVRVGFKYRGHDVVSNWVSAEVTELQIRTKHIELGP